MRILFAYPEVAPLFCNGGIGTFVFEASRLLADTRDWEVDILTDTSYGGIRMASAFRSAAAVFAESGIRLMDLDRSNPHMPGWASPDTTRAERYYEHVSRLHAQRQYDVIEFPDWKAPGFFMVRNKVTRGAFRDTRLVLHLHSSTRDVWQWQNGQLLSRDDFVANYMEEYVKRYADIVLSPTEFLLAPVRTAALNGRPHIRNGYPLSAAHRRPRMDRHPARRVINVACVSRLELRKGQDILARSIRNMADDPELTDVRFLYCGRDSLGLDRDGKMSVSIRRILQDVHNWEILPPKGRAELATWLADEIDVCVVPSRCDNYPNVVIEAARAGCQMVCSDAGGIPEILRDYGIDALLFRSEDDASLEIHLREAIARAQREPGLRGRLSSRFECARQHQTHRTIATYQRLVAEPVHNVLPVRLPTTPCVSIIIPFHNAQAYVRTAVASAFASEYADFEVILVDDGSDQPEALTTLHELQAEFPALRILHKQNGGLGDARNAGIAAARGEFIVPLDADNMLLPGMLAACSGVLAARPQLAYVTTYFECLREKDGARLPWQRAPLAKPIGAVDPLLMLENTAGDALGMIRKSALEEVGGYATAIYCFEDWDLWLQFHERGFEGDVLPEVHFIYRLRKDSMSRSVDAGRGVRLHQALLSRHQTLVKEHAVAVSTLLLQEYWPRWRPNGGSPLTHMAHRAAWRVKRALLDMVSARSADRASPALPRRNAP